MRIALLTFAHSWRGSGTSFAKIACGLRDRGHTVRIVTAARELAARFAEQGLDVTRIPGERTGPRHVRALVGALRALGAQAMVADTVRDLRLAACASLLHPARLVYRYNVGLRRGHPHWVDRVCLHRAAACVYQSDFVHAAAVAHAAWVARIPSYHIPNGYDTKRFAPRPEAARAFRESHGIPERARVVLSAGKLSRNKGHEIAIAALVRLRQEGLDLFYVLCGAGHRERELVSMARTYKLPAVFPGLLGTTGMIAAYSAADLVVHPSLEEIFPNAVGEAMACARTVVAADAGGTGELVGRDGRAGVLIPPGDVDALAGAIRALFADPARLGTVGDAARRRIEEHYPLHRMVERYENALAEVTRADG